MILVLLVSAFVVILAAGIYRIFLRDLSAARARLAGRSAKINTSFGVVEYVAAGEGEPVLIAHGAGGGFDQGIDIAGALAEHGYQLIAPSRFGYLASTLPANPTTARQADAYAELLDSLGIDKAFVIGISAGEWSSLQFAIRYPQRCRGLALLVPANFLPPDQRNFGGPLVRLMFGSDFAAWAALKLATLLPGLMTGMMLGTDSALVLAAEPSEKARVQQVMDHLLPVSARSGGMEFDMRTAATPSPYLIERIACPVLTISAQDDMFGTAARAEHIAANVPDGRAVVYPSGGHALVGRQAEILREIVAFLDQSRSS